MTLFEDHSYLDGSFGAWIKRRRKSLDMTQQELARRVGCSISAIFKIEADERRPSRQIAELLAQHLKIPAEQVPLFIKVARLEKGFTNLDDISSLKRIETIANASKSITNISKSSLPVPATSFVGREFELSEIIHLIRDTECRLLTLTGTGGVGKTRLALETARYLQDVFEDGVYFIQMGGIDDPDFILSTLADALGFTFSGPVEPRTQLINYLYQKHMLIVLDNMEHLLDSVEQLSGILERAPRIVILTTSREPLHLQAEWTLEVQGLPFPEGDQNMELEASSAAVLFVHRARQAQVGFTPTVDDHASILAICRLVQGLPLAIELAAAWVRTLSCQEIAQEIRRSMAFLAASSRDVPERHRSITAVFDHSWDLLSTEERMVLAKLSVFHGSFNRSAAENVTGATLTLLGSLVGKSLLRHETSGRYNLHELVRQYAAVQLGEDKEAEQAAHGLHASYYLKHIQQLENGLRGKYQKDTLTELLAEIDNIHAAWNFAIAREELDLLRCASVALYYFYELHQNFSEAESLFKRAADMLRERMAGLAINAPLAEQARLEGYLGDLLNYQAFFNLRPGNNREALRLFQESIPMLHRPDETFSLSFARIHIGVVYWAMGNFEEAIPNLKEGLFLSLSLEHTWLQILAKCFLGAVMHDQGNYAVGYQLLGEAMELSRDIGDPYFILLVGIYFSRSGQALGKLSEAHNLLREDLQIAQDIGNHWIMGGVMVQLGVIEQANGDEEEARRLLEKSISLLDDIGDRWSLSWAFIALSRLALSQGETDEAECYAVEALKILVDAAHNVNAMDALVTLAEINVRQEKYASALEKTLFVLGQAASTKEAKDRAEGLLEQVQDVLPHDQVNIIQTKISGASLELLAKAVFAGEQD